MIRLLLTGLALLLLSWGCAPGGYYQRPEPYTPSFSDVPPDFYDNDPTLRDWFTAPYWDHSRN